jgi:hypothetical protein
MDRKGLELTVSTTIIMIISVVVLVALFIVFKDNFSAFKSETEGILDTTEGLTVQEACKIACLAESRFVYCCNKPEFKGEEIACDDSRLELECELSCEGFDCGGSG